MHYPGIPYDVGCFRAGCDTCGSCCDVPDVVQAEAWEAVHQQKNPSHETGTEGYPYAPVFINIAP